jgi:hypothetical protein
MKNKVELLKEIDSWYINLDDKKKNDTCVFCVVGDMDEKENADLVEGSPRNLVITLAQAMLNDPGVCELLVESVNLYNSFINKEVKKAEDRKGNTRTKFVS